MGGIVPGVALALLFCLYIYLRCQITPALAPMVPKEEQPTWNEKIRALLNVIAPIVIIVLVLGCINAGIATPTEASGVGAFAAFAYAAFKRKLTFKGLAAAVKQTTEVSVMLMWIMIGGAAYCSLVNITQLGTVVAGLFAAIELGPTMLLLVMVIIYFLMGMFLDTSPIAMITIPVLLPVIKATGLDVFRAMLTLSITLCLGMITPPFGVNMFYLLGVTPKNITLQDLYKAVIPFVLIISGMVLFCVFVPEFILWLPNRMFP